MGTTNNSTHGVLASQQKILSDLQVREEERVQREAAILKELSYMNKIGQQNFAVVEKHFKKMMRKIMGLSIDKASGSQFA